MLNIIKVSNLDFSLGRKTKEKNREKLDHSNLMQRQDNLYFSFVRLVG